MTITFTLSKIKNNKQQDMRISSNISCIITVESTGISSTTDNVIISLLHSKLLIFKIRAVNILRHILR